MRDKLLNLITTKLDNNDEAMLTSKKTGMQYFIKSYDGRESWSLYEGCDLVVGDVTMDYIVRTLLRIA